MVLRGTVLVVDDDPFIVEFLEEALTEAGYRTYSSAGSASLRLARDQQPDLILLDIMMPEMDGVEVSKRLRADPSTAAIPIVVMSAQDRLQSVSAHMPVDDRLSKPFNIGDLYSTVERWVNAS